MLTTLSFLSKLIAHYPKMDITSSNFAEKLPLILESVKTADFIAIDSEFSGLSVGFEDQSHVFDSLEDRYQKYKHCVSRMNAF